jgi:hypothetical protein
MLVEVFTTGKLIQKDPQYKYEYLPLLEFLTASAKQANKNTKGPFKVTETPFNQEGPFLTAKSTNLRSVGQVMNCRNLFLFSASGMSSPISKSVPANLTERFVDDLRIKGTARPNAAVSLHDSALVCNAIWED